MCSPCGVTLSALESDTTCANATDANTVCMGTCRVLYDDIINNCDATVSVLIATQLAIAISIV